jgi:hypothetical protein
VLGFAGVPFCLGNGAEALTAFVADEGLGFFAGFEVGWCVFLGCSGLVGFDELFVGLVLVVS